MGDLVVGPGSIWHQSKCDSSLVQQNLISSSSLQSMDPGSLLPREQIERLFLFESAREKAAAEYAHSPLDAENLTKWGGVLLELAQFRQGQPAIDLIEEAISKFEEALQNNSKKHDTLWCLGNAYTSEGFLVTDSTKAYTLFRKATQCFQNALEENPDSQLYLKALEMSLKAPSLHHEIQKQLASQQASGGSKSGSTIGGSSKGTKKKNRSDLKYDILGWIVFALGVVAWIGRAKSAMSTPPRVT